MKRWILALLIFLLAPCTGVMAADSSKTYILHPGDMLSINVAGHPDLSFPQTLYGGGLTIGLDGKFTYPFLGEVDTQGLTVDQLAQNLSARLQGMYVDAVVSVNIMRYGKERIYVLGEVNRPGSYELDKVRTLLDAVGAASGWRTEAAKTKVFIIRKNQTGQSTPIKVNLMTLLEQGDTSKNYLLREGDVVFLTGSHKIDLAADLLPLVNAAYQLAKFNQNNGNGQNTQVTQDPQNPQSPQNPQNPSNPNNPNNPSNPDPGCH
jgi:polysaccharide export outer membrane protein